MSSLLTVLIVGTNLFVLGMQVNDLVTAQDTAGTFLLVAALQVWTTNVIALALLYWGLDRVGPILAPRSITGTNCRSRISGSPRTKPRAP